MKTFNSDFYKANKNYTREIAESKMTEKGYSNFSFTGCSYSNGASFYFTLEDGRKVRVSDHNLTGKRAFDLIQIRFVDSSFLPESAKCPKLLAKKEKEANDFKQRLAEMIATRNK
jgi:hypothetical protein